MEDNIGERTHETNDAMNVFIGLLIGGLAGAAAMLLFAPQSGKRTRTQIYETGILVRDRTTASMKKAVAQVSSKSDKITAGVREKAGELKQLGQDKLVKQMDRVSAALDAGKAAVEAA
jgi:gas vesicle protein